MVDSQTRMPPSFDAKTTKSPLTQPAGGELYSAETKEIKSLMPVGV